MAHLLVVGGSDAGISAALRAREIDPSAAVTVVVADSFPNYSICGLPFYLSGEVADWRDLAHRTSAEIEGQGIDLLLNHAALGISSEGRQVLVRDANGFERALPYDRLIIATGATPVQPPIAGLDQPGVYALHTMIDSFALHQHLETQVPRSAVIVGGGYIGLEMADALTRRGIDVTLVQRGPSVLNTLAPSLSHLIMDELQRHGVEVFTNVAVAAIERSGAQLAVIADGGFRRVADFVLVATGVRPGSELAQRAGITTGTRGAISVTRAMETNFTGIYAAGDCVETWHRLLQRPMYLPLGTTAHKQGRVAGENVANDLAGIPQHKEFAGSLGTQVVKIFDLAVARTGLLEAEAQVAGFSPFTMDLTAWDHKHYYPGAYELHISVTGDRSTGRLLGAHIVGHWKSEVAKRIDIFATALFHEMRVEDLSDLDLSYTPPLSSPWDPVQLAAQRWEQAAHETPVRLNDADAAS